MNTLDRRVQEGKFKNCSVKILELRLLISQFVDVPFVSHFACLEYYSIEGCLPSQLLHVLSGNLADRLDAYFIIRNTTSVKKTVNSKENSSKPYAPKRNSYDSRFDKTNQAGPTSSFNRGDKLKTDDRSDRPSVSCYGCGKPGVTKPRCPNCKPAVNKDSATFSNISLHSCSLTPNQSAVLKLAVNGIWGTACADSGASHSIAGETLYLLLQKEGANFQKTQITMSLADGHKSEVEVYTTSVVIRLE
ncbi:uncharacterized protein TNCT_240381, partial [Trichonephila clavata]